MLSPINCIICDVAGLPQALGLMEVFCCPSCGLFWRRTFDVSITHYEEKPVALSEEKIADRLVNSKDRINTFRTHTSFNHLVDIGCGEGVFLKAAIDAGFSDVKGIEPSKNISAFAQKHGLTIFSGTLADIVSLPVGNIEVISMFHLIEHLPDPKAAMQLLYEVLPPGGRLVVETPDISSYAFTASGYRHKLVYPEHLFYFKLQNIRKMLEGVGFAVVAEGKRDFNQYHMNLQDALFRLGLRPFRQTAPKHDLFTEVATDKKQRSKIRTFISLMIRKVASLLVVWCGRTDYLWIIVQK